MANRSSGTARTLMVQGTTSDAGKSVLTQDGQIPGAEDKLDGKLLFAGFAITSHWQEMAR